MKTLEIPVVDTVTIKMNHDKLRTTVDGPWITFRESRITPETGSRPKYLTWIS